MKTIINIMLMALAGLALGSCSVGIHTGKSNGAASDGIYYMPGKHASSNQANSDNGIATKSASGNELNLTELDKKYASFLANNDQVDTLVYKADSDVESPYEKVLSTTYRDSYERRLRGRSGSYAGNWGYYSSDFWYASAYDPSFYNLIVLGDEVWVEPYYISAMFAWPRPSYYFGFGFGWGHHYNPWYWNSWHYPSWGWGYAYNPYYSGWGYGGWHGGYSAGYNNGFWNGYYWGDNNAYNPTGYYTHGPRPGTGAAVTSGISTRPAAANINDRIRDLGDNQPVLGNTIQRNPNDGAQEVVTTRPNTASIGRDNGQNNNLVVTRPSRTENGTRNPNGNGELVVTRPSRGGGGGQGAGTISGESVRGGDRTSHENFIPTYTRPKPASSSEYNRPGRAYTPSEPSRGGADRKPAVTPSGNNNKLPARTYSPPPRTNKPTSTPSRGNSGVSQRKPASSSSSTRSTPPPARSSSGSSSSGSSSSSSRSSGSTNTRSR